MARIPFFETTWRRKARLTGIVLGVYLAARLLTLLSEKLVGLGWGDIPVSLLVLIYLALLYVEIWIILERHTRPVLSVLAASLLAGLCLASPFIAFDPVATGSIPDRLRFWEPMAGIERPLGQRIAVAPVSFLPGPVADAQAALGRTEDGLLEAVGLARGASRIGAEEAAALLPALEELGRKAGLPALRVKLWADAALIHLDRFRAETTLAVVESRVACLEQAASRSKPAAPADGAQAAGPCGAVPPLELRLDEAALAALAAQPTGATSSFLDGLAQQFAQWTQAARQGGQPAGPAAVVFRASPAELDAAPFAAMLADPALVAARSEEWSRLPVQLDRYRSALHRFLRVREATALLDAQLALIPRQIEDSLATQRVAGSGAPAASWTLLQAPELVELLSRSGTETTRLLDARPREVLAHAEAIADPAQQEVFLSYLSQTQHWHLRHPDKVKARLQQAEDEFRSAELLGAGSFPPVGVCQAMARLGLDAAVLQLASLDRQGDEHLRLLLLNREPCLVVWDHDVPIYEHSDVLASTADDGRAMTEAAAAFFSPCLLGTDYLGKDMLMQLVKGTEGFFLPGLLAVAIGLGLGVLLGAFAGYMGGRVDKTITFFTTLVGSFPRLVFILLVCTIPDTPSMIMIGGITGALFVPQAAEAVRRRVLALKAEDFILASRAHGLSLPRILFYHMVWLQCFPEIVRQALYLFVYVIFLETALSYLEGPGAPPEIPSWGRMLANATSAMFRGQYWHALVPTAAIVFTTLGVAALGDVIVGQTKEERL